MALHEQSMPDGAAPGDVSLESQERDRQAVELRTKQAKKGNKIARSIEVAPSGATENPIESVPATLEVAGDVAVAAPADATELTSAAPVATTNAVCGLALQTLDRIGTDLTKRLVECAPTKTSKLQTERCLKELRSMVQELGPGWDVTQFGSAANGFNTVHSDLDITCFVPREKQSVTTQLDATSELRDRVLPLVRQHQDFEVVGEIFGAKVPILKLRFEKELDVDLSCHNLQPLVNTRLLKAYSVMDRNKVGRIGIAVKLWSKAAAVCGSAKGSLSSYAFMLMMLYFMQVHEDVLMPVLAPEAFLQDGRENTDTSANALKACWRTDLTVADLLVLFFSFYANQFKWGSEVASVRVGARHMASEPIYSKLRARQAHRLHIEDPYEVDRNLHGYVDEKHLRELFAQALRDLEVGQVPIGLVPMSSEPEGDADALQVPASKAKCDAETTSTWGASAVGKVRDARTERVDSSESTAASSDVACTPSIKSGSDEEAVKESCEEPPALLQGAWWQRMDQAEVAEALNALAPAGSLARQATAEARRSSERHIPVEIPGRVGTVLLVNSRARHGGKDDVPVDDTAAIGGNGRGASKSCVSSHTSVIASKVAKSLFGPLQ